MTREEARAPARPIAAFQPAASRILWLGTAALLLPLPAPAADQGPGMAEIVVTTRKMEERLSEVPLAITAFSEKSIESAGITDLRDIANLTPGLQFYNALGEALPTPIIRGVAPTDIKARENNAAIFIDGIYISGREGLNFSQLDLDRIEVVKGPQSALYGRNAFSGAINFVTKRPSDSFEAKSALTAGNRGKLAASGSVSGPIIDGTLKGRIGVGYDAWDGSYDDPLYHQDVGGYTYRTVQGSLLWTPTENLDILAQAYYSNDDIAAAAVTSAQANCEDAAINNPKLKNAAGVPYGSPIMSNNCGKIPSMSGNDIPLTRGATGEEREVFRSSLNIDWDLGIGTLTALTGYIDTQQDGNIEFGRLGDSVPFVYCVGVWQSPSCSNGGVATPLKRFFSGVLDREGGNEDREFTQELRFSSPANEAFRWSAGVYYYNVRDEEKARQPFLTGPLPADLQPPTISNPLDPDYGIGSGGFCPCQAGGPGGYLAPFGNTLFLPDPGYANDQVEALTKTRSWAIFTSVEQDFLERWKVRGELRYTWETKNYQLWAVPDLRYEDHGRYAPRESDPTRSHDNWDWLSGRLTLDYKTDNGWLIYSSLANARKSGGFTGEDAKFIDPVTQIAAAQKVAIVEPYDPEKNWTVEVGIKGRTADRRLGLDLSAYRIDWSDIVLPQTLTEYIDPTDGVLKGTSETVTLSRNTGDATVWGWELQADLLIDDHWNAGLGISYTDSTWSHARQASYQFFPSFYTTDPGCSPSAIYALPTTPINERAPRVNQCAAASGDISGNQMLRISPWTVNASLQYRHQLMGNWDFYGRTDVAWKDKWFTGNDNQSWIPQSTFVNLKLGVESGRYTVEAFVDNLFDYSKSIGAYRDIHWSNTQDIYARNNPPTSSLGDFPPMRMTINQPRLRTWGLTARVRFGGAER